MPAINAHGEFTPTPENHMTPRPHPSVTSIGSIENEPRNLSYNSQRLHFYLDYMSPCDYEQQLLEMKKAA